MKDSDLMVLWHAASELDSWEQEAPSPEETLAAVKQRAQTLKQSIHGRDLRERLAAVVVAGSMIAAAWPAPGWLPKIGTLAAIAILCFVLTRLSAARRPAGISDRNQPVADLLRAELLAVEAQIELLQSIRSRYIRPLIAAAMVWLLSLLPALHSVLPTDLFAVVLAILLTAAVLIFGAIEVLVAKIGRQVVAEDLEPLQRDLATWVEHMEA